MRKSRELLNKSIIALTSLILVPMITQFDRREKEEWNPNHISFSLSVSQNDVSRG